MGTDGTAIFTVAHGGCVGKLKLFIFKSLKWFSWLLHLNEFPLRHLFTALGGKQLWSIWRWPIGKNITAVKRSSLKNWQMTLSTDKKYNYEKWFGYKPKIWLQISNCNNKFLEINLRLLEVGPKNLFVIWIS